MRASCGTQTQIISVRASLPPAAGTEAELGQRSTTTFADGARYSIYIYIYPMQGRSLNPD